MIMYIHLEENGWMLTYFIYVDKSVYWDVNWMLHVLFHNVDGRNTRKILKYVHGYTLK